MILITLLLVLQSYTITIPDNRCFQTCDPYLKDFHSLASIDDEGLTVSLQFPVLRKSDCKEVILSPSEIEEEFEVSIDGTMITKATSLCSVEALTPFPSTTPKEPREGTEHIILKYKNADSFPFDYYFLYDYKVKPSLVTSPKSSLTKVAMFQVHEIVEEPDPSNNGKKYRWTLEVQHRGDVDVFFRGLLSNRETESSIVKVEYDGYDNTVTVFEISAAYEPDEKFESETCFFQFQQDGDSTFEDQIVDLSQTYTGHVILYSNSIKKHNKNTNPKSNLIVANPSLSFQARNISFDTLSISSEDSVTISNVLELADDKFAGTVSGFTVEVVHIKIVCTDCEESTDYFFEYLCSSMEEDGCIGQSKSDTSYEYSLTVDSLLPGKYRIVSRFSFDVVEKGVRRTGHAETFSHLVVSPFEPSVSVVEMLLSIPVLISGIGLIGAGMFILRFVEKRKEGTKLYDEFGERVVDPESGNEFVKLNLEYKLRHKEIEFRNDDYKSVNKRFTDLFRLQKASKYTPYVHCKHCYLEQHAGNPVDSEVCFKCGLPIVHFVEFCAEDRFCVVCSLMNKYQPRPHGRCLLHLSVSKRRPRLKQGSVYVLYRDHYSVGSASRQMKKSNKNDWIERVTQAEVWKLNSLIRFEYLWLLKDLIKKPLGYDTESLDVMRYTLKRVSDRISHVGPNMMSEHYRRLKLENLHDGVSEKYRNLFCDSFRRLLVQLVMVLQMNIKYFEKQKKRLEKKRKREFIGVPGAVPISQTLKKARGNQNQVIARKREIEYEPDSYLGILDTKKMMVQKKAMGQSSGAIKKIPIELNPPKNLTSVDQPKNSPVEGLSPPPPRVPGGPNPTFRNAPPKANSDADRKRRVTPPVVPPPPKQKVDEESIRASLLQQKRIDSEKKRRGKETSVFDEGEDANDNEESEPKIKTKSRMIGKSMASILAFRNAERKFRMETKNRENQIRMLYQRHSTEPSHPGATSEEEKKKKEPLLPPPLPKSGNVAAKKDSKQKLQSQSRHPYVPLPKQNQKIKPVVPPPARKDVKKRQRQQHQQAQVPQKNQIQDRIGIFDYVVPQRVNAIVQETYSPNSGVTSGTLSETSSNNSPGFSEDGMGDPVPPPPPTKYRPMNPNLRGMTINRGQDGRSQPQYYKSRNYQQSEQAPKQTHGYTPVLYTPTVQNFEDQQKLYQSLGIGIGNYLSTQQYSRAGFARIPSTSSLSSTKSEEIEEEEDIVEENAKKEIRVPLVHHVSPPVSIPPPPGFVQIATTPGQQSLVEQFNFVQPQLQYFGGFGDEEESEGKNGNIVVVEEEEEEESGDEEEGEEEEGVDENVIVRHPIEQEKKKSRRSTLTSFFKGIARKRGRWKRRGRKKKKRSEEGDGNMFITIPPVVSDPPVTSTPSNSLDRIFIPPTDKSASRFKVTNYEPNQQFVPPAPPTKKKVMNQNSHPNHYYSSNSQYQKQLDEKEYQSSASENGGRNSSGIHNSDDGFVPISTITDGEFDVDEYIQRLTFNDVSITVDELSINDSHGSESHTDFFY